MVDKVIFFMLMNIIVSLVYNMKMKYFCFILFLLMVCFLMALSMNFSGWFSSMFFLVYISGVLVLIVYILMFSFNPSNFKVKMYLFVLSTFFFWNMYNSKFFITNSYGEKIYNICEIYWVIILICFLVMIMAMVNLMMKKKNYSLRPIF